ncbi:MAG: FecR domain-containing protein [Bacteroidales bacterium]|nr:FecR domain-containing protein [Bacteroidales bacterium]
MKNDTPLEVSETFERWLIDDSAREEKDKAMRDIWDDMSLADASAPEDPFSIISEAEKLQTVSSMNVSRRKTIWLWTMSAVAACMTVFAAIGWFNAGRYETCLASSETSKGEFVLPDGTKVWLNRNSRLYYSGGLDGRNRKVRLEGEGYFDVVKDSMHPFIVEAGRMSIRVTGTSFTVSAYEGRPVKAYLETGSIVACAPGHEEVFLVPDHAVMYDVKDNVFETYNENATDHTAWIDARLEFFNKPLTDIMECLEHWYGIDIICNDMERASDVRLSMMIRQESVEEIMSAIGAIADLSYFIDSMGDVKISFVK